MKSYITVAGIFISYRRDDAAAYAGRIYDRLSARFGADQVFIDVDDIKLGDDFVKVLEETEKMCRALVVVIGRTWLTIQSDDHKTRLFDEQDFVRREIAAGLKNGVHLFPVLVGGSAMPGNADLPDDLKPLANVQALVLRDGGFQQDMDQLIAALENVVTPVAAPASPFDGRWRATVKYSWGDSHEERFQFETDEDELLGTASYGGVSRAIQDGTVTGTKITFVTKSMTMLGDKTYEEKHGYSGKLVNGEIAFRLLTDTGYDTRLPEMFTAVREKAKG